MSLGIAFAVMGVAAPASVHAATSFQATFDSAMLDLINQDRAGAGEGPLVSSPSLHSIAEDQPYSGCGYAIGGRAEDLLARNYFAHQLARCGTQNVFDIMRASGIHYTTGGENIAWESGFSDPVQAARYMNNAYMNSPEHRANILNRAYTRVGLGSAATGSGVAWSGGGAPMQTVAISTEDFADGADQVVTPPVAPPAPCASTTTSPLMQARASGGTAGSDIMVATGASTCVMVSSGSSFAPAAAWSTTPFAGSRATLPADVNGDGKSDLVAVNDASVWVMLSNGAGYSAPVKWSSTPFYGSRATLIADVSGDGRADLVAINDDSVWVMLSNGAGFDPPVRWLGVAFYGSRVTVAGDTDGDGRVDLLAVNDDTTWVVSSTGSSFAPPARWSAAPFYGSRGTTVADLTGGGATDLVAINDDSVWVMLSNGSSFAAPVKWSSVPFYGSHATLAADVNGDGKADLVATGAWGTWVMTSTGSGFSDPARWSVASL